MRPTDSNGFAALIDQTLLSPTVGSIEAVEWIERNADRGFASLCVSPWLVPSAASILEGSRTAVCTVVGFPLGTADTVSKASEAARLIDLGARELDVVMNVGAFLEADDLYVYRELAEVARIADMLGGGEVVMKAIIETGYLDAERISAACELAVQAGYAYVKTSTGFGPRGASIEDVVRMRSSVPAEVGVKASGGIRDLDFALALVDAGASRIGASSGDLLLEAFAG